MEFLAKLNKDPRVVAAALIVMLLITLIIKYKKKLYYSFDGPSSQDSILNSKYRLDMKRGVVDVNKINSQLFTVELIVLIISGIMMLMVSSMIGLVIFLIGSKIGVYVISQKIGKYYSRFKADKEEKAKSHKKSKKKKR